MLNSPFPSRLRSVLCLFIVATFLGGCQQYGEVSPKSHEFATALYSICNRKDEARLATSETAIQAAVDAKELPADEAEDLQAIIEQARDGQWTEAMQDCRTLMSEQNVKT